ncbi:hypothetical protein E2C01_027369 [Portunus trituberculatus]|uniref:Uncharacterized protein n=1 Tax=Portunus trituberculatus TaxID=210409 RepID=A0A5B7EKY7_PORTR|nr:hypothetical protein [Portunus trituberculatus]
MKLHSQAYLVATLVKVLAINKGGESESDAIPNLLLISQTHLSRIINFGPQSCILVQSILASDRETCGVGASRPGQIHSTLQLRIDLVEEGSTKLCPVVSVVPVAGYTSTIDHRSTQIQRGVQVEGEGISLIGGLEHPRLLATLRCKGGVEHQLEPLCHLIFKSHLTLSNNSKPIGIIWSHLPQGLTVLLDFVLGLQVAGHLARLKSIVASSSDLHTCAGLALAF